MHSHAMKVLQRPYFKEDPFLPVLLFLQVHFGLCSKIEKTLTRAGSAKYDKRLSLLQRRLQEFANSIKSVFTMKKQTLRLAKRTCA